MLGAIVGSVLNFTTIRAKPLICLMMRVGKPTTV